MKDHEKLEWIHHAIQEAMKDNPTLQATLLTLVEELREPYLQKMEDASSTQNK